MNWPSIVKPWSNKCVGLNDQFSYGYKHFQFACVLTAGLGQDRLVIHEHSQGCAVSTEDEALKSNRSFVLECLESTGVLVSKISKCSRKDMFASETAPILRQEYLDESSVLRFHFNLLQFRHQLLRFQELSATVLFSSVAILTPRAAISAVGS